MRLSFRLWLLRRHHTAHYPVRARQCHAQGRRRDEHRAFRGTTISSFLAVMVAIYPHATVCARRERDLVNGESTGNCVLFVGWLRLGDRFHFELCFPKFPPAWITTLLPFLLAQRWPSYSPRHSIVHLKSSVFASFCCSSDASANMFRAAGHNVESLLLPLHKVQLLGYE